MFVVCPLPVSSGLSHAVGHGDPPGSHHPWLDNNLRLEQWLLPEPPALWPSAYLPAQS